MASFLTEGDLTHIKRTAESYTPGIAYDTRWFEWTLKLLEEVEWHRKLQHTIDDLRARFAVDG